MKFHKAKPGSESASGAGMQFIPGTSVRRGGIAAGLLAACLACLLCALPASAQQRKQSRVDLLIARNEVNDPFFYHSVVLMLTSERTRVIVGVIINKPTRMTLSRLFPDTPALKGEAERAYFGGPVAIRTPSIIFRSPTVPKHALRLFGDVYLTFDAHVISRAMQGTQTASTLRLYLGRAQWAPGQLRNEIRRGSWYQVRLPGDVVFSSHPEDLWRTLHARAAPSKYIRYRLPAHGPRPAAGRTSGM